MLQISLKIDVGIAPVLACSRLWHEPVLPQLDSAFLRITYPPLLDPKGGSDLKDDPEKSKKQPEKKEPEKKEDSFDALAEIIKRESEG